MNVLKEKLKKHEKISGTHISLSEPLVCDMIGNLGFDFVWIDMEHSYLSYNDVNNHIIAAKASNVASLIRVPQDDGTAVKKILEMGPDAILFPMVSSIEQVNRLIDMTLYPPYGHRGFGPMRAIRYGLDDIGEFIDTTHKDICRFIQIEQACVIDELEKYVQNEYIDAFIFGPNDLSGSINKLGHMYCDENLDLIKKGTEILKRHNKNFGVSITDYSEETLRFWREEFGMNILSAGADYVHILNGAAQTIKNIHSVWSE